MNSESSTRSLGPPTTSSKSGMVSYREVPLTALSKESLEKLSTLLNSTKPYTSEDGYERDWRGLAYLAKQQFLCDEKNLKDPLKKVLQFWCKNNPTTATFGYLENYLGLIDRWDVSDDIQENLLRDTEVYQRKQQNSLDLKSDNNVDLYKPNIDFECVSDPNILTISDVSRSQRGLPPQMYDAFVLYADADINYVAELLTILEDNPEYGFKFCLRSRDLLSAVQFKHVAVTKIIEERCKHLIVILTEEFLKSPENEFLVNYTQVLQIQNRTRKIIPLLYEETTNIPRTLKMYTLLRYKSSSTNLFNFWSKLASSLRNVNAIAPLSNGQTTLGSSAASTCTSITDESQLNESVSLHNANPSKNVIIPASNTKCKKTESLKLKQLATHIQTGRILPSDDSTILHNADSSYQLNTSYEVNNVISMSAPPTESPCNDVKKWSTNIFKKVFNRKSYKLQKT